MRAITITTLAALALAGCGASKAETPATAPAPAKTPASTPAGPATIGITQSRTSDDITVTATVYHARTIKSRSDMIERSRRFLGIEVRVCVTKSDSAVPVGQSSWTVDYADDTTAESISEWWDGEFSVPLYPVQRKVVAGQCARGWIMFKPLKGKPIRVAYAAGVNGEPAFWRIP